MATRNGILSALGRGATKNTQEKGRNDAARLLALHGVHSLGDLGRTLTDGRVSTEVRATACWMAGQVQQRSLIKSLLNVYKRARADALIWEAAKALSLFDDRRVNRAFELQLRRRTKESRRVAAAYCLGFVGRESAVAILIAALRLPSSPAALRSAAAEALGLLRATAAGPELTDALSDRSAEVRGSAAHALGQIGERAALPALARLAARDKGTVLGIGTVRAIARDSVKRITSVPSGRVSGERKRSRRPSEDESIPGRRSTGV
jgi:HEAT repeat protein